MSFLLPLLNFGKAKFTVDPSFLPNDGGGTGSGWKKLIQNIGILKNERTAMLFQMQKK
jgi:hypothetical protein